VILVLGAVHTTSVERYALSTDECHDRFFSLLTLASEGTIILATQFSIDRQHQKCRVPAAAVIK